MSRSTREVCLAFALGVVVAATALVAQASLF